MTAEATDPSGSPTVPRSRPATSRSGRAWGARSLRGLAAIRLATWAVAVGGFALFVAFGTVAEEAGTRIGERTGVAGAWRALGRDLPSVGHATLLRVAFYGALALLVVACALGLLLALTAESEAGDADRVSLDDPAAP